MPAAIDPLIAATAQALGDAGWQGRGIARQLGIADSTIQDVITRHGRWGEMADAPMFVQLRATQQRHLESAGRALAAKAMIQTEIALPKASALQAATVAAIMIDKSRILAGEPTEIHANLNLNAAVSIDKLCDILNQRLIEINATKANDPE